MQASGLSCLNCGHLHALHILTVVCERCGWALAVAYPAEPLIKTSVREVVRSARRMWDFFDFLPVADRAFVVDLGEGGTPLLAAFESAPHSHPAVFLKNETRNPTGSFKDRPLSVIVSMAREHGVPRVVTGSSGNAGVAMAAYAARAGIEAIVVVPRSAPPEKLQAIRAFGARVLRIDGSTSDALFLANTLCAKHRWLCASTTYRNPFGLEGDKTVAYELARDFDFRAPTHVFIPIGSGPLLTGCYRGFLDLVRWGVLESAPRMIGVQARGCAPIAKAYAEGTEAVSAWERSNTIASGIADELAGYESDGVLTLRTVRESGGAVLAVSDEEIIESTKVLAQSWGILAEPTGAAALAGLRQFSRSHGFSAADRAVCIITGSGFKDAAGVARCVDVDNLPVFAPSIQQLEQALA